MLSGEERETNVRTSTRELAIYILFLTVLVIGNTSNFVSISHLQIFTNVNNKPLQISYKLFSL